MPEGDNQPTLDYRLLFEQVPAILLVLTPDLRIAAETDARLAATMTTREETLGRFLFDVFTENPEDPGRTGVRNLSASLDRVLKTKKPDVMPVQKYDLRRPDGTFEERYWNPVNTPVLDAEGNIAYIIHQVEDVTQAVRIKHQFEGVLSTSMRQREEIETLKHAAQFRLFVQNIKDYAIFMLDPDGRVVTWNEGAAQLSGHAEAEVTGRHYAQFFPPEDVAAEKPERLLAKAVVEGRAEDQGWLVRRDGSRFWADSVMTAIRSEKGSLLGFANVTRDLTERKHLMEYLAENESRYRSLYVNSYDAILLTSLDGSVFDANPVACQLLGYTADEFRQLGCTAIFDADDPRLPEAIADRWERGGYRGQLTLKRRDGRRFEGEVATSAFIGQDGKLKTSLIIRDVTERVRAEEMRARLAAIVTYSGDAIFSVNADDVTVVTWNQGAEQLFGYRYDEIIGQPASRLVPPHLHDEFKRTVALMRRGEGIRARETTRMRKDGSLVDVSLSWFPVLDQRGKLLGFSAIARDITNLKKALEEVATRSSELKKAEELSRLKDHFLSTVSHEIKTPLAIITGYAELLEKACPAQGQEIIAGIQEGSRRLNERIEEMLDYSALISGSLLLYETDINLEELIAQVRSIEQESLQLKRLQFELEIDPTTPTLRGDSRRITQILLELVKNAAKFTPEGGKLGVRIMPVDGQVRIDVWDSGPGIPEKDFERIWGAFSQLAIEDASRQGGLGLGLTIVKLLAELHGGKVAVVSALGKGSTFSVYLPVQVQGRSRARPAEREER